MSRDKNRISNRLLSPKGYYAGIADSKGDRSFFHIVDRCPWCNDRSALEYLSFYSSTWNAEIRAYRLRYPERMSQDAATTTMQQFAIFSHAKCGFDEDVTIAVGYDIELARFENEPALHWIEHLRSTKVWWDPFMREALFDAQAIYRGIAWAKKHGGKL